MVVCLSVCLSAPSGAVFFEETVYLNIYFPKKKIIALSSLLVSYPITEEEKICFVFFHRVRADIFSLNRPTGPIQSVSCDVRGMFPPCIYSANVVLLPFTKVLGQNNFLGLREPFFCT